MSILVAMVGSDASVVATDSRRIDSDGTVHDDHRKTFRLSEVSIVGGHTGLLEFGGRSVPEWLNTLPLGGFTTIDAVATEVATLFEAKMTEIDEAEVAFVHRIANVALVGRTALGKKGPVSIRVVELRPDTEKHTVVAGVKTFAISCAMGDPSAQKVITAQLDRNGTQRLSRKRLTTFVKGLITMGTQACGLSPGQSARSCGGPAHLDFL